MRKLSKLEIPEVLATNATAWTEAYIADQDSNTKKYRYRDKEIKSTLLSETDSKCAYCESKIGHNTPGDVEHKLPSSLHITEHFNWGNLTIACTECNRRKNAYYSAVKPFIDPYSDDVDERIMHHGPIVGWKPGDQIAEISVKTLELDTVVRKELISRKVEKINQLNNLVARIVNESDIMIDVLKLQLEKMKMKSEEYSGMVNAICATYGL